MRAFLTRISPLNNAEQDQASRCSSCRAGTIRACRTPRPSRSSRRRAKNGAPVWYLLADNEGHGFARKANADFQFYAMIEFIRTRGWTG